MTSSITKVPDKGDPSDILQIFSGYNIQLLCCRYWWLKRWEYRELSFPYWRIYHNIQRGAFILHDGKTIELLPDKIYLIAPNTSYATKLFDHPIPDKEYKLEGGRIGAGDSEEELRLEGKILHLFIHFNIGMPYDTIVPGIFTFDLTEELKAKLDKIRQHLNVDYARFSFYSMLNIQALISDLLSAIPESSWDLRSNDYRIIKVLNFIEAHISQPLSNEILAAETGFSTNSFTRFFTEETGMSPQRFVRMKRINKACVLLHHSDFSVEKVADETGFTNRYHFSRVFKSHTGLSPAQYKKEFQMED